MGGAGDGYVDAAGILEKDFRLAVGPASFLIVDF
jgi:hypothetical protein